MLRGENQGGEGNELQGEGGEVHNARPLSLRWIVTGKRYEEGQGMNLLAASQFDHRGMSAFCKGDYQLQLTSVAVPAVTCVFFFGNRSTREAHFTLEVNIACLV